MRHPGGHVPQPYTLVVGARSQSLAIRRPRYGRHTCEVTLERVFQSASLRVPDLDGTVGGGGSNPAAIWGEFHGGDTLFVAPQY